jgi:hypothetical protein
VYVRYIWQGNHHTYGRIRCAYTVLANPTHNRLLGLARTIYIRCTYGIFGFEIIKYTVYKYVYIRFWPTLEMHVPYNNAFLQIKGGVLGKHAIGRQPHERTQGKKMDLSLHTLLRFSAQILCPELLTNFSWSRQSGLAGCRNKVIDLLHAAMCVSF